jgi:hypothetical protein
MALSRLCSTEQKLKKDPTIGDEYKKVIRNYIEAGYVRKLEGDRVNK